MILNPGDQRHVIGLILEGELARKKANKKKNRNNPNVGCSSSKKNKKTDGASRRVKKKKRRKINVFSSSEDRMSEERHKHEDTSAGKQNHTIIPRVHLLLVLPLQISRS